MGGCRGEAVAVAHATDMALFDVLVETIGGLPLRG